MLSHTTLKNPLSAIIFDCDGTLSAIEGIDELAKNNNVTDIVQQLTQEAMGKTGMTVELYQQRLSLVKPTRQQIMQVGEDYIRHRVADIDLVINMLKRLNKSVYIVSAGIFPAVLALGKFLSIPEQNIFAVNIQFDSSGNYLNFDHTSPLVNRNGKRIIVNEIKKNHPQIAYVGDGLNDLEVYDLATRFIGYGGIFYRKNIAEKCEFYLKKPSLLALLPLLLTQDEMSQLTAGEMELYNKGNELWVAEE